MMVVLVKLFTFLYESKMNFFCAFKTNGLE